MEMKHEQAYLVIDIGTGNVRVAVVADSGKILCVKRENVQYHRDELYPDALHFEPARLWAQISQLSAEALKEVRGTEIKAITASSQREGVVVLDGEGGSVIGLPNHDHRGREWEKIIPDPHRVYQLTGRYPSSLFSALKIVALTARRPQIAGRFATMVSISDWAQYCLTGIAGYEHSQASETILYDVEKGAWSRELCDIFGVDPAKLPPLRDSGSVLGPLLPAYANLWGLPEGTPVLVGGADTQLAINSTRPGVGDVVIVSGTTTPVIKIVPKYLLDDQERTWTNRHVEKGQFILETNCGVTGLNYQRLKEIFYPKESYEVIEAELDQVTEPACVASLGSLLAREKTPLGTGGFVFNTPVSHELTRADFSWAVLWDMACAIRENFDSLIEVEGYDRNYVWACGGGFQSRHLRSFVAGLIDRKVLIRSGYEQASVTGGANICASAMGRVLGGEDKLETVEPQNQRQYQQWFEKWRQVRAGFIKMAAGE